MGAKQTPAPIARHKLLELLEALHGATDYVNSHLSGDANEPFTGNASALILAHDLLRAERHRAANTQHEGAAA